LPSVESDFCKACEIALRIKKVQDTASKKEILLVRAYTSNDHPLVYKSAGGAALPG
jgi:hypothetical protein